MTFQQLTEEEFIAHTKRTQQLSFMQTPEMAQLLQKRGAKVEYIGYTDDEGIIQVSALLYSLPMAGGLHMEINSGPICTDQTYLQAFYKALQDYAKEKGALELLIKPYSIYQTFDSTGNPTSQEQTEMITTLTDIGYQFDGLQTGYPEGEPSWHYIKNLTNHNSDTLLSSFNKNSQRNIKKAKQLGISIRSVKREELDTFTQLIQETGKRQGFSSKDTQYYHHFFDSFQDKAAFKIAEIHFIKAINQLQIAYNTASSKNEKASIEKAIALLEPFAERYGETTVPLAGALMIYLPTEVTYLFGGSNPTFQKLGAPFLLQYETMIQAIEADIATYNFLGITGIFDGSDGVLRFKQNFNGHINRHMGIFRYYPSPLKYKIVQTTKQVLARFRK
ncbi:aminoacyltransferase [Streptococcus sp. ZJ151]|uniref:aminoacyltransferase n=1 Tax=Streptococcus jiangjianxini TaxID=3161189 RepID=UPI0032ED5407